MNDTGAIAQITRARQFLAEAKDLSDIKAVRDMAEAARLYARAAGLGQDAMNEAAEVKLRAERKAGDALAGLDKHKGGRPPKTAYRDDAVSSPPTLSDLGISDRQSQDWQAEASVPEAVFEEHINETKATGEPLTTAGVVRLARPAAPAGEPIEDVDGENDETMSFEMPEMEREPEEERAYYALTRQRLMVRLDPATVADAASHPEAALPGFEEYEAWFSAFMARLRANAASPVRAVH